MDRGKAVNRESKLSDGYREGMPSAVSSPNTRIT